VFELGGPGRIEHGGVACGLGDGEPEHVSDASHVARGGDDFVEDAVLTDGFCGDAQLLADAPGTDRSSVDGRLEADEQVRIGGPRPSLGAVVQPGFELVEHDGRERDRPTLEVEPPIADVCKE
jgi:hypothetical protein